MRSFDSTTLPVLNRMYAFLLSKGEDSASEFSGFPVERCFYACMFAENYFSARSYEPVRWVFGYHKVFGSHVWLEFDGWVIDLTASQFPGIASFLFYSKEDTAVDFHSSFIIIDQGPFDSRFRESRIYREISALVAEFTISYPDRLSPLVLLSHAGDGTTPGSKFPVF
ncbi:MAG TPA: hypothetical protein PKH40_09325 [Treponemataceae bacterium]|nr:hypothetical protein [Treponemataceae bacterium]HPX47203.1 hypothetical protein [Treponemataceae bacterium]HQL33356.1 hypothetical protein [Treponemataceae bacterium]